MKELTPLEVDMLKQFTIEKIKQTPLEELQQEYLSNPTFKQHVPEPIKVEEGTASRTRKRN